MFIFIKKKNEIMENKKFIQIMKKIVREEMRSVIKQELTEILQEGLSSTISQLQEKQNNNVIKRKNTKTLFKENKFSDILNETEQIREEITPSKYASLMSEDIHMTSADAMNFGMQRKSGTNLSPTVTDVETGETLSVQDPAIAKAMPRDYSALMKAIDKKRNK